MQNIKKMKKQIKYIYVTLLVASLLIGLNCCTDELNQNPTTQKQLASFLTNEGEVEEYVNAVYSRLQTDGLYKLYIPVAGEIPSDNTFDEVPANDGQVYGQMDLFQVVSSNGALASIWREHYIAIQAANTVLNRIDNISFANEDTKKAKKGEMYFLRGLFYFNLVRIFGDVPLVTKETTDPFEYFGQGRQPVADIYNQVKEDLEQAKELLPPTASKLGQATKYAAHTLMGKVHLTLKEFTDAKKEFEVVKNSGAYEVLPVDKIFGESNENNKEVIFDVQFAEGVNGNSEGSSMQQQFSPSGTLQNAKGHNLPTVELYNLYDDADLRKHAYVAMTDNKIPYSLKLTRPKGNAADGGSNFIVLRYSDVILMLAEIENELGNTDVALGYLNQIRTRAGLKATTATDKATLAEIIATERRFELVNEGHRWFDLIRTGKAVQTMNDWFKSQGVNITIAERHLLQLIPQSQIDTDKSLTQNP